MQVKPAIVLPTYNERDNIEPLLRRLREVAPEARIVVVDDASPDGTGQLADACAAQLGSIDVVHRPAKAGLASAYFRGFEHAISSGADVLVTMDADFSHDPAVVPALLAEIESGADVAIGSRYVAGGGVENWPFRRRMLSRAANLYATTMLGIDVHDCTSGFRAYKADVVTRVWPDTAHLDGYAILVDTASRLARAKARIHEVPITFTDRRYGKSKMTGKIIFESIRFVTSGGLARLIPRRGRRT